MNSENPLLFNVKLPGRVFQLPSKGLFYEKGVLSDSVENGEIQVKPMSALAEMKLRSVDLLFTGKALEEICKECVPDILDPNQLVYKDVDALFLFLRMVTYGNEMSVKSLHECDSTKIHDYMVNLESIIMKPNNSMLDHKDSIYKLELEDGITVHLRPITFKDTIEVAHMRQILEQKMSELESPDMELIKSMVIRDLMSVIKSVEIENMGQKINVVNRDHIEEWVKKLPRTKFNLITAASEKSNDWGFNLSVQLKCRECGSEYTHNLELDPINFFSG